MGQSLPSAVKSKRSVTAVVILAGLAADSCLVRGFHYSKHGYGQS